MLGSKVVGTVAALAGALAVVLATAAPAAAGFDNRPVRLWSFSEIEQGVGKVRVARGAQQGGLLHTHHIFGSAAFNFPESKPRDRASGDVFSSASGKQYAVLAQAPSFNSFQPGSTKGGLTHLDEYQAYVKPAGRASLVITISNAVLDAIDANHGLLPSECPPGLDCRPIRSIVRFRARAYAVSAGGDFFNVGGVAYIEGYEGHWTFGAVTLADSRRPLWIGRDFSLNRDVGDTGTGSHAVAELKRPGVRLSVPLSSLRDGELFAVHVSMDAEAIDARGRESAVEAFIRDPQDLEPSLLKTTGLKARGAPKFPEPPVKGPAAVSCPAGPGPGAGTLQLSAPTYVTDESTGVPMFVLVTRTGGSKGAASVTVSTRAGSAEAGGDYKTTSTTVRFSAGDASSRLVEIPILEDQEAEGEQTFSVALSRGRCATLGAQRSAEVTIADDDVPPSPPPSFTIGGTVDGLQGSRLVLHDLGSELAVLGNGPFTLPGTRADGLPYDVVVTRQPSSPDQTCTVTNGAGTVHGDVGDIAVHCVTPAPPPGLDPTFGDGGRVSTPVPAGEAEAVILQPDGGIITAGRGAAGGGIDFAATRHDATGNLDLGFGTGGIVTTDLGGQADEALDAAAHPDGGFVLVGRVDRAPLNRDIGVARYNDDGSLDTRFGGDGIVTTDFSGEGDEAYSVAVQSDGKIIVAGLTTTGGVIGANHDVALVRYNGDGSLDTSFGGGDGKVSTDLGTTTDIARAVVLQPDGRIVVAGTADGDVALARYLPDGGLDTSFGDHGTRITDFGSDDFANGVALTAGGQILVAGHTLGSGATLDFALARYSADGGLDPSFGTGGIVRTDVGGGDDFAENLTVQPDGRIVVVGRDTSSTILDLAVVRYGSDGTLDTGFGTGGIITADFHGRGEFGQDVALQPDGKIVAAGYTANGFETEFALLRINP